MEQGNTALKLVTPEEEVSREVVSVEAQAKALKVVDAKSYLDAGELWKSIKALRKKVADTFDPLVKKAFELHKNAVATKKENDSPLEAAERMVKQAMSNYDLEQERIRRAEEARLAEIARKEEEARRQAELARLAAEKKAEEDRLMEAALAAEMAGDQEQAEALSTAAVTVGEEAKQEAAAIQAEPVYVAPVVLAKTTPKLAGGPVYTTRWSASVTDIKALCLAIGTGKASTEFVIGLDRNKETGIVTSPSLNKQAVSLMNTMCIPGVQAISKRV